MSDQTPVFDPEAVREKYQRERAKRMTEGRGVIYDLKRDQRFAEYTRDPYTPFVERDPVSTEVDVAIIGAGMSGVVMGAKLRDAGLAADHADRQGRGNRRHVVLEPLSRRDVRRRVVHLHADAGGDELRPHHALRVW